MMGKELHKIFQSTCVEQAITIHLILQLPAFKLGVHTKNIIMRICAVREFRLSPDTHDMNVGRIDFSMCVVFCESQFLFYLKIAINLYINIRRRIQADRVFNNKLFFFFGVVALILVK